MAQTEDPTARERRIEQNLVDAGYKAATSYAPYEKFEEFLHFAVNQLSGVNRTDAISNADDYDGIITGLEYGVMDVFRENSKSFIYDSSKGKYLHFYEYFDQEYLAAANEDFLTSLDKYGTEHPTRPGFTGNPDIQQFETGISRIKAEYSDLRITEIGSPDEGRLGEWTVALKNAERKAAGKAAVKYIPRPKMPSAADRARKAKKELNEKKRRLTQQSLLLLNLEELTSMNRDVYHPNGYSNFVCVEDGEPSTFMSRLMGLNFLPISRIKNNEISSLVPEMRFFKIDLDPATNKPKPNGKREVFFPTFAGVDQKSRYSAALMTDFNTLIKDGSPNIGVKSVEWSNRSGNALLEKRSLQFQVQIYAERISDLFAKVVGQSDEDFKYSDLFTLSSRYADDETKKPINDRKLNPDYYRMQAQFGWRLSEKTKKELAISDPASKQRLETMADYKMTVDLSLVNFDLDFNEDGSAILNLSYTSFVESYTKDNERTNVLMSPEEVELHKELKKKLAQAEKEKNQLKPNNFQKVGAKGKVSKTKTKEIREIEKGIKDIQSNLNTRFSSIIKGLVQNNSIRVYTVKDDEILRRYQTSGLGITEGEQGTGYENLLSVQKQFNTDDYEELSIIEISDWDAEIYEHDEELLSKKSSTRSEEFLNFLQNRAFAFLKKVRKKSSGKEFYLYYVSGSNVASTIPEIHDNEFIPVSKLTGKIGKFKEESTRNSASSAKGKSGGDRRGNEDIKQAVLSKQTIKNLDKDLDKAVKELSKNYYNSSSKEFNIKFFYLGDLIEIAVENLYKFGGSALGIKTIVGSVALKNYVGNNSWEEFFNVNTKGGYLEITRNEAGDEMIRESAKGKSTAKIELNAKHYYRNIADIPISLSAFLNTFNDLVVKKKRVNLSFHEMIKIVYKMAISSLNSIDDEFFALPRQGVNLSQTFVSAPKLRQSNIPADRKFGYFGERLDSNNKMEFNVNGRQKFEDIRNGFPAALSDSGDVVDQNQSTNPAPISLFEQRFKSSVAKEDSTDDYIILHDLPRTLPPHKLSDFEKDSKNGIPHFFIGASSGLVKNIKFSLKENPLLQAGQMLRRTDRMTPNFPIKGIYEAEVTMMGNVFFSPGSVVYINPAAMKLGNPKNPNSPINSLGIAGYYMVLRSNSYVQEGTYETKLNCKFQSPGNGLDRMGTNYVDVPTREEINLRNSRRGK